ncbi:MAG: membrane protein insertase YidC, partial [Acidimicrobiales bacterium]
MPQVTATVVLAAKFWILDPLYVALGTLLSWFYDIVPSYGVAIIMLTIAVRLLTFPLTAKQARSQQQLQKLQPELKRLQAKYKGDKQKLNEEMMKFYKEHHVNPLGGCLPLFIQAPVLLVLYRLILGLTRTFIVGYAVVVGTAVAVGGTGGAPTGPLQGAQVQGGHVSSGSLVDGVITKGTLVDAQAVIDGRVVGTVTEAKIVDGKIPTAQVTNGTATVGTLADLTVTGGEVVGAPKNVPEDSSLFHALKESSGTMVSWGMDLAQPASEESGSEQIPFLILIALVGATGFYQQRQLTARLPKESLNSQMALMGKVFPLIFVFVSWTIPAGVVVYFLVSNIWQIGQQAFMFRNQPKPEPSAKDASGAKKGKPTPKANAKAKPGSKGSKAPATGRLAKGANPLKGVAAAARGGKGKGGAGNRGPTRGAPPPRGRKKPGTGPKPTGAKGGQPPKGGQSAKGSQNPRRPQAAKGSQPPKAGNDKSNRPADKSATTSTDGTPGAKSNTQARTEEAPKTAPGPAGPGGAGTKEGANGTAGPGGVVHKKEKNRTTGPGG